MRLKSAAGSRLFKFYTDLIVCTTVVGDLDISSELVRLCWRLSKVCRSSDRAFSMVVMNHGKMGVRPKC